MVLVNGNSQTKIAVTGTAVKLPSNGANNGFIITAKSTNTAPILLGFSDVTNVSDGTGNGYILEAGASVSYAKFTLDDLWINGAAGDIVSIAGS